MEGTFSGVGNALPQFLHFFKCCKKLIILLGTFPGNFTSVIHLNGSVQVQIQTLDALNEFHILWVCANVVQQMHEETSGGTEFVE
jgi:hypothetical protein